MTEVASSLSTAEWCDLPPDVGDDGLVRTAVSVEKANGSYIRGLLLEPQIDSLSIKGLMMIASGFGRTIRHSTALALECAHQGFSSLRFDMTDHTGDSDGEILDAKLSNTADDLLCVAARVRANGWRRPLYAVASSLAARATIRAASLGMSVDGLVLILPVVDFSKTVAAVTGDDLVHAYLAGAIEEGDPVKVLTHVMSGGFLADAVDTNLCGLATTQLELAQIKMPVAAVVAENDDWVAADDVVTALGIDPPFRQVFVLESADHDSYSFGFLRALTQTAVRAVAGMADGKLQETQNIGFSELFDGLKIEKKVLKRARQHWRNSDG